MKIKKRYIISCVILCILSVLISIAVFHLEMTLSKFSKLNDTISDTWYNTELFITTTAKDTSDIEDDDKVFYLGKVTYITNAKYDAYNENYYMNRTMPYYGEAKMGDKVNLYYKPDDPEMVAFKAPLTTYVFALGILLVIDIALIVTARLLNKSLKENTFSDAPVSIMDIPICVLVAGFIICFFMGMFIGNISINSTYTDVNKILADQYYTEANQYTFGSTISSSDTEVSESADEASEDTAEE